MFKIWQTLSKHLTFFFKNLQVFHFPQRTSTHIPFIIFHTFQILWLPHHVIVDFLKFHISQLSCHNPTLAKCGGEAQHLEKVGIWSPLGLPNVQSSTERPKTPRIGVFLVSLERSWNVDVENGLALAIWTSAAQIMGKRKAGSQIGSLTPDH
jgi:hypothetical protein